MQFHVIMRAHTTIICLFIVQIMFCQHYFKLFTFYSMPATDMHALHLHNCSLFPSILLSSSFVCKFFFFLFSFHMPHMHFLALFFNSIRQLTLHLSSKTHVSDSGGKNTHTHTLTVSISHSNDL